MRGAEAKALLMHSMKGQQHLSSHESKLKKAEAGCRCCVGSGVAEEVLRLLDTLEDPLVEGFSPLSKDVPLNILIPEDSVWIDIVQDAHEIVKVGIQQT